MDINFVQVEQDKYNQVLEDNELFKKLMNEFCDRVEKGEVRSYRTYSKFCKALGRDNRYSNL